MSRLVCCVRARGRTAEMGAALSHPQEGEACEGGALAVAAPPTMADVIRERKKKAGGAGLGTLRRRIAAAARRPRDARTDRGCEHARFIRSVVSSWRVAEVFVLCEQLEAGAALRDLVTQADLAREPAPALAADLPHARTHRWWCDVELVGAGWSVLAHRAILAARCTYFRQLLHRYPSGTWRVPLEGAGAALSRDELEACLLLIYGGNTKWERGSDGNLDIINVDNNGTWGSGRGCECGTARRSAARLAGVLGVTPDALHRDMRYLLDSGEYADSRLVFRQEGCGGGVGGAGGGVGAGGGAGGGGGFRAALELPCHRAVLAARSRFFRSVMSRRTSGGGGGGGAEGGGAGAVCVDEQVLPRRFARALLHAAYTDQVDLSLIGPPAASPPAQHAPATNTAWPGVALRAGGGGAGGGGGGGAGGTNAALEDAFQLYEIARFVEMGIAVQGCEDAIVGALSPHTLPRVLRWCAAPHASQWVHRQAMRYLRDEFSTIMSSSACGAVPRAALADALRSPLLQASEAGALRALLRWGHYNQPQQREPNVVWHTAHSVSWRGGGGAGRGEGADGALREALRDLAPLVRVEHLPPDTDVLLQAIRRGVVEGVGVGAGSADAWLGRGAYRPARAFLPYLDELRALLHAQHAPDADIARVRHRRLVDTIPDTLYMVAAARGATAGAADGGGGAGAGGTTTDDEAGACVSPRVLAALRARLRELRHAPPALTALRLNAHQPHHAHRQIALRAVREMSLPDSCADLLLAERDPERDDASRDDRRDPDRDAGADTHVAGGGGGERWADDDCWRAGGAGAAGAGAAGSPRCVSAGSLRARSLHIPIDTPRSATCRRELPSRPDHMQIRSSSAECRPPRLSAAVPDVAMAPNANTHLLTARDYCHAPPAPAHTAHSAHAAHAAPPTLTHLQLDLGDGATHTPAPGSRALRAAHSAERVRRALLPPAHTLAPPAPTAPPAAPPTAHGTLRPHTGYPSVGGGGGGVGGACAPPAPLAALMDPHYRPDLPPYATVRGRSTPSPSALSARHRRDDGGLLSTVGGGGGGGAGGGQYEGAWGGGSPRRSRRDAHLLYRREYPVESVYSSSSGGGGGGAGGSRGGSPNNYA